MNIENIRVFLCVSEELNLTKAAEKLFLSQPTVSNRLRSIEDELNVKLFIRNKGVRTVELTPEGQQFLPLAEQWAALYNDIGRIKEGGVRNNLRVGCPDTLSDGFLLPFFEEMLYLKSPMHLELTTYHAQDIVRSVAERSTDISLGFYHRSFPNVISRPIFREKILAVLFNPPEEIRAQKAIHPSVLRRSKEIFTYWSPEIQQWHNSWWVEDEKPFTSVDTISQIRHLMRREGQWMIIPYYMARVFSSDAQYVVKMLDVPVPERICYLFKHRFPDPHTKKNVAKFEAGLLDYCKKIEDVVELFG